MIANKIVMTAVILGLIALAGGASAAQQVTIGNVSVNCNETASTMLVLDSTPTGLSGFKINLTIGDPSIADNITLVSYPSGFNLFDTWGSGWADSVSTNPVNTLSRGGFTGGSLMAVDLSGESFPNGSTGILLVTVTLHGHSAGTTTLHGTLEALDDNFGNDYIPSTTVVDGTITVIGPPEADFSANVTSGEAPLAVGFEDQSTGSPTSWSWTFGDGGTSTARNPVHTYSAAGTYTVGLIATNAGGSDSEEKPGYITVSSPPQPPVANFTANVTAGTAPLAVKFTDTSTGSPSSWSWSFGDGNSSAVRDPVHVYASAGTYTVNLTVTNAGGSDNEAKANFITVTTPLPDPPVVNFIGDNRTGQAPLTVHFTDQSTNNPTAWAWDFGDGGTSGLPNPSHTYTAPGTYPVNLTASNAGGSGYRLKGNYIVVTQHASSPPVVDFTADSRTGTAPFTVHFTDLTVTSPTAWAWDFGDGGTSGLQNPSHTYIAPGTYPVNLTATNASGTAHRLKASYITVHPEPLVADFVANATTGMAPFTVQFVDISTGLPTSWQYTFGDGGTSTLQNPVHTYTAAGTYTVNLTAGNAGGQDTKSRAGYIVVTEPPVPVVHTIVVRPDMVVLTAGDHAGLVATAYAADGTVIPGVSFDWTSSNPAICSVNASGFVTAIGPGNTTVSAANGTVHGEAAVGVRPSSGITADFDASPETGRAPCIVQFTDRSTGNISARAWDFGDGTRSSLKSPMHVFGSAGTYTVTLTVSGKEGSDTAEKTIVVTRDIPSPDDELTAALFATPTVGRAPLEVRFSDGSRNADAWAWDFGDGNRSFLRNPVHTYSQAGSYRVTLVVNGDGDSASASGTVMVMAPLGPPPVVPARISAMPIVGRAPLPVRFSDNLGSTAARTWNFGDGSISYVKDPVHVFTGTGTYTVTLVAVTGGRTETARTTIWVQ